MEQSDISCLSELTLDIENVKGPIHVVTYVHFRSMSCTLIGGDQK